MYFLVVDTLSIPTRSYRITFCGVSAHPNGPPASSSEAGVPVPWCCLLDRGNLGETRAMLVLPDWAPAPPLRTSSIAWWWNGRRSWLTSINSAFCCITVLTSFCCCSIISWASSSLKGTRNHAWSWCSSLLASSPSLSSLIWAIPWSWSLLVI